MKTTYPLTAVIQFTFEGPVAETDLRDALIRALKTREFRLVGGYNILAVRAGEAKLGGSHATLSPSDSDPKNPKKSPEPF